MSEVRRCEELCYRSRNGYWAVNLLDSVVGAMILLFAQAARSRVYSMCFIFLILFFRLLQIEEFAFAFELKMLKKKQREGQAAAMPITD